MFLKHTFILSYTISLYTIKVIFFMLLKSDFCATFCWLFYAVSLVDNLIPWILNIKYLHLQYAFSLHIYPKRLIFKVDILPALAFSGNRTQDHSLTFEAAYKTRKKNMFWMAVIVQQFHILISMETFGVVLGANPLICYVSRTVESDRFVC